MEDFLIHFLQGLLILAPYKPWLLHVFVSLKLRILAVKSHFLQLDLDFPISELAQSWVHSLKHIDG